MKAHLYFLSCCLIIVACKKETTENKRSMGFIGKEKIEAVTDSLVKLYGEEQQFRIERGVNQVAAFWTNDDGDENAFSEFCKSNFIANTAELDIFFQKIQRNFELLNGNMAKLSLELREPLELDMGEITQADMLFASYSPGSHIKDDFFKNKIAFHILLNFPYYDLKEKTEKGEGWTRKEWAYARAGDLFTSRVPADILLDYARITTEADAYIAEYNIYMGNLVDNNNKTLFSNDLKLISHWGLRDELKSQYTEAGLEKQKMIYSVMNRIINQEIPEKVINSNEYLWNPLTNKTFMEGKETTLSPEDNTRYQHLMNIFKASQRIDDYSPYYNSAIKRAFDEQMQMTKEEVERLFIELLSAPQVKQVAELIKTRLGRDLEPFDIWYNGFKDKPSIPESELDAIISRKYPSKEVFEKELPAILVKLGFDKERSQDITSKITVDASRGAGHATGAEMRTDKSHLRTRITEAGMNYKGYNIAVHEFGHNVEQTITLYDIDHYFLKGVPNTAFTEALAFVFQTRDLDLLGINKNSSSGKNQLALDIFWSSYEIMGVSLVDMYVWDWMYNHPDANAAELKESVLSISKDVWNKYYADVFGIKDQAILAIYSHMIAYPLYLSAYPVGHLISYQIEEHISGNDFAEEIHRIFTSGNTTPGAWMRNGMGKEISNQSLLKAVDNALKDVNN